MLHAPNIGLPPPRAPLSARVDVTAAEQPFLHRRGVQLPNDLFLVGRLIRGWEEPNS